MSQDSMVCAGIDTGKRQLEVALPDGPEREHFANEPAGHAALSRWLGERRVARVGIEASGGYEQEVVRRLRRDGFVVLVFQPAQVRAYAMFQLRRAKNDRLDAALIATCTAAIGRVHAAPDPRLAPLAAHLTLIEQVTEDIARCKTRREGCREARLRAHWTAEIDRLEKIKRSELAQLAAAIRGHADLAARLALIMSVEGVGLSTAVAVLVRMPEIGQVGREVSSALVGLAPYDDDSGGRSGARHIAGGRGRLRKALYCAALPAAFRWNPRLMALYRRLTAKGKPHKVALIACARKLLIFINAVVARGTPWLPSATATPALAQRPARPRP